LPKVKIGLSDHTLGNSIALAAVALGATVIEKHFTFARSEGGVDSAFSMEPSELAQLCKDARDVYLAIGKVNYNRSETERKSLIFRRSIYASKDIAQGEKITEGNVRVVRPGLGLEPKYYFDILGKKANKAIKFGTPFKLDFVS